MGNFKLALGLLATAILLSIIIGVYTDKSGLDISHQILEESSSSEKEESNPHDEELKIVLSGVVKPVKDAPKGTYIIEYNNGDIEILHPDGTIAKLVKEESSDD